MDYRIWITYHNDEQIARYGLREDDAHRLFAAHKDIDGKNINGMNPVYSEMVTMWYVWKNNLKSKYVGFNHYRRQFAVNRLPATGECQVIRMADFGSLTVYDHYARHHSSIDMDVMLGLLDSEYGNGNGYSRHIRESHVFISHCCFLMRWTDFVKLCQFMFPLLECFAEKCGAKSVDDWRRKAKSEFGSDKADYQARCLSFLAERLISAWITVNLTPYIGGRNVATVHYNTPILLEAAIKSLMKHTPGCRVYVFDNSDREPFKVKMPNVEVIDNTKGQIIDFDKELAKYPDKQEGDTSNFGSAKHCMSVDRLMELIPDGFVLMDSDVVIKRDISHFWDRKAACLGGEEVKRGVPLLMPFLCWLNVPMLRERGIRYFNGEKMWVLSRREPDCRYDTGAWLLEEVRRNNLPASFVDIWQYIEHFRGGSWRKSDDAAREWLSKMRQYFTENDMAKKKSDAAPKRRPTKKSEKKDAVIAAPQQQTTVPHGEDGIDIVVPMVFPNGQTWLRTYRETCSKAGIDARITERFRSWDLERYFFRGIAKNMPFIRKIHLIVSDEGQVPFWLDTNKVHVVLHKDIIPEELLPTFNSSTIEMWLHKIDGLSETFIYCNDDMIAVGPMEAIDFFIDGRPVMRCAEKPQLAGDFMTMCRTCYEIAANEYGVEIRGGVVLRDGHTYTPLLLSVLNEAVEKYGKAMHDSCTTFREPKNLNQYLYSNRQWLGGKCVNGYHSHCYYSLSSDYDKMSKMLLDGAVGVACFNDGGIGDWHEMRTVLYKVLQKILGEKCEYEV